MFWYNKSLTTERQRGRHIYLHASSTNILSQPPLSLASALRIYFQLHFANGEENASHNSAPTIGPDMTHTHRYTLYSILYMPHWPGHGITFGCLATQRNLIKVNMRNCSYFMLFAISIVCQRKQAGRQGGRQGHVSLYLSHSLCLSLCKVTSQSRFLIMYKIRQQDSIYRYLD